MRKSTLTRALAVAVAALFTVMALPLTASASETIQVVAQPGGSVSPASFDNESGAVTLTATASAGNQFLYWDLVMDEDDAEQYYAYFGNRFSSTTTFTPITNDTGYPFNAYYVVAVFGTVYFPPYTVTPTPAPTPEPTPEPVVTPEPEPEFEPDDEPAPIPKTGSFVPAFAPVVLMAAGLYAASKGKKG